MPRLVCAAEDDKVGLSEWEGIPLERLPRRSFYTRLRKLGIRPRGWTLSARFLAACRRSHPALLHVHQLEFDVKEFYRRVYRPLPIVLHAHVLSQTPCAKRGVADRYIAVSDYVAAHLVAMGYPPERITTIRNGVDTRVFRPGRPTEVALAKERLGVGVETPVLAFVGRKHDVKGYPTFLAVAKRLLENVRPLLILAIGADPERPSAERGYMASRDLERRLAQDERFRMLPAMPQLALAELYRAIDVTLLPSLAETQGMAMIESLAAGCVTISARVGGIGETLTDGETGFLIDDPRDTEALYGRAFDVLTRLPALNGLRAAARFFAEARLDWSVSAAKLDALYETLIA